MNGLIIDLFAGAGGASTGIEAALGYPVDIAINHDPIALAVHRSNHPNTRHVEEDIWKARPLELVAGRSVAVLWASPDCTHHSNAKGGKPRSKKLRTLAWAVTRWAKAVRPAVIFLENVIEFKSWGPLTIEGKPDKRFLGKTFNAWTRRLERLGYQVEYRTVDSSHHGAPTKRKRLFLIARCDGLPIVWPAATHGRGRLSVHTAAECIDWTIPCPSIFERPRPLVDKTLWRIAQGLDRFVFRNPQPFIVGVGGRAGQSAPTAATAPVGTITAKNDRALVTPYLVETNHGVDHKTGRREHSLEEPLGAVMAGGNGRSLIAPTLVQTGYGEREGQAARVLNIEEPLGTVVAGGAKHALVAAFLTKHYGDRGQRPGSSLREPVSTITACDHNALTAATLIKFRGQCHGAQLDLPLPVITGGGLHYAEVRAFLTAYHASDYAGGYGQSLADPLRTVTTTDRLGLVMVLGWEYLLADIGMRMLNPFELLRAQFGRFACGYDLSRAVGKRGKPTHEVMVRLIGNSVSPETAEAIVRANVPAPAVRVAA